MGEVSFNPGWFHVQVKMCLLKMGDEDARRPMLEYVQGLTRNNQKISGPELKTLHDISASFVSDTRFSDKFIREAVIVIGKIEKLLGDPSAQDLNALQVSCSRFARNSPRRLDAS